MPFVPKFSACFEGPILDNVLLIIERDMQGMLNYFYASDSLPDFAERSIGEEKGLEFPLLVVDVAENPIKTADDSSHLIQAAGFELHIGVIGDNAEDVTRKVLKYQRCLDAVLRSASKADYFAGITDSTPFGMVIEVGHRRGLRGKKPGQYFQSRILDLTVNIRER